jgi:NMD protein affecting ribosome stability and mRNA decay
MSDRTYLSDEALENVSGGTTPDYKTPTRSNFCPRCRSPEHHFVRTEGTMEVRACDQCHLEYYYRKY